MKLNKYLSIGLLGLSLGFASCADEFLTVSPVRAFTKGVSEVISPDKTLMKEYLPY